MPTINLKVLRSSLARELILHLSPLISFHLSIANSIIKGKQKAPNDLFTLILNTILPFRLILAYKKSEDIVKNANHHPISCFV